MFLGRLSEKEKKAFLSLSVHASKVNGVFEEQERVMLQEYCKEMGMSYFDENNVISMNEIVAVFLESELSIKKIVLLETLGLVYADGNFDSAENKFVNEYAKKIGLTDEDIEKQTLAVKEYLEALKKVAEAIA